MNTDKRYCQNRGKKRKRTILPSPVEYKNISPAEKIVPKRISLNQDQRGVKKVTIPKPMLKRGLYQNGIQTKFYTRGGVTNKEMTGRLDENMQQIISLGNNNQCSLCTHHCKGQINYKSGSKSPKWGMEPQRPPMLAPLLTRSSPSCEDLHLSPSPRSGLAGGEKEVTLSELDKELYPLFTRVISVSSTQNKSALFKNQSYVSSIKRKLLDIHVNGIEGGKQQLNCLSEPQKATSSVGTSPLHFSSKSHSPVHKSREKAFKLNPSKARFQNTMEFLSEISTEEIGPSSTSTSKQMIPSPQYCKPYFESDQLHQQLLSPPVVTYQRPRQSTINVPKLTKYVHEPFVPSSTSVMSLYNFRPKMIDGRGDGFHFNCFNSFLPPIQEEEDSPDFRYFPRKIF